MNRSLPYSILLFILLLTVASEMQAQKKQSSSALAEKIKRFVPTEISADISGLSEGNRKALEKLIEVAKLMDSIYLRQVWSGNIALLNKLRADTSPEGAERLHYFRINMSPWSALDDDAPFIPGVPKQRPPYANYYPADMTKQEFTTWYEKLRENEKKEAAGFFHTIRRDALGKLAIVSYRNEYEEFLKPAALLMREAAVLTDNQSLKTYLAKRADAYLSNDYYESDVAWMDLDSPLDITIGPYEVYMDEMFNYKAAFEAFITLRNEEESRKLEKYSSYLQEIENNLPIESKYRNPTLGALSPIRVVDELYLGGEARAGVQTAAFNLPNDDEVVRAKGSKRVMLKNVQEAKFNKVLLPISRIAVDPAQQSLVSFDPFFTHILAHELMHGLGPNTITVDGKQSSVRQAMKDLSSAMEEAKADISGLFALQFLIDEGVVEESMEQQFYATYLAGVFRSVRFGINDAHGKGMVLQFNYLVDKGAFEFNEKSGAFRVNFEKIKGAAKDLTAEIMTIQAEGDYNKASELLAKYVKIRPKMQSVLDKLAGIPVDIEPIFSFAQ